MELQQLRYFVESAQNENFSHTAARNFVPPSAVSASVKKLELELGCKLFERGANKLRLNQNGRAFLSSVKEALALIDSAKDTLVGREKGLSGDINLLIRTERSFVTEKIIAFRRLHPNITFHLSHTYAKPDFSHYDIIIDELSEKYKGCERAPIVTEQIKIAASSQNPLCGRGLTLKELRDCEFITMSKGSSLYGITMRHCAEAGFEPYITIESDDPLYIRRYISQNFGIAFYPERSWEGELGEDISFLNVTDFNISRTTCAYISSGKKSPLASAFYKYLISKTR